MTIFCTQSFEDNLLNLKKKNSYFAILEDVCNYFKDKDILELHITRDIINTTPSIYSLNKYRIPNSNMKRGKSGSYRCICICSPKTNCIYLGCIYPKTGSDGFDNLSKQAYKEIASNISQSIENKSLKRLDIDTQTLMPLN